MSPSAQVSPDVFLSQNGIASSNTNLGANPTQIVSNFKILNTNRDPQRWNEIAKRQNSLGMCARCIASARLSFQETGLSAEDVFATDFVNPDSQNIRLGAWFDLPDTAAKLDNYEFPA